MRMTVLASGSKGNSTVVASARTRVLVDAGLSCRELLRRMALAGEDPTALDAILITHEHIDHVAGLPVLARRLNIPVFFTEPTHRAWVRMVTPRTTMTYAQWLDHLQREKETRAVQTAAANPGSPKEPGGPSFPASPERACPEPVEGVGCLSAEAATEPETLRSDDPNPTLELPVDPDEDSDADLCSPASPKEKLNPATLPAVEYFHSGTNFCIGDLDITPFTIPHDAADPCGFVFHSRSESIRMAIATDLGYVPPNVKAALKAIDVLLLESNHDLEMLRDGPYPWSVKQRVLSRVGHLSNHATAEFLAQDYDGAAAYIVLGHLSESNNVPELARLAAEQALIGHPTLLGNRVLLAHQSAPLDPISL
jgi:phosphoribosyl 1,2-cyclic phosphodiesterase